MGSVAMSTDSVFMMSCTNNSMKRRMNWCWVKLLNLNFLRNLVTNSVVHPWCFQLLRHDLFVLDLGSDCGGSVMDGIDMGSGSCGVVHNGRLMSRGHMMGNGRVVSCDGMMLSRSLMVGYWGHMRFSRVMDHRSFMVNFSMVDRGGDVMRSLMGRRSVMKNRSFVLLASVVSDRLCWLFNGMMFGMCFVMRSDGVMSDSLVLRLLGLSLLISH